MEWLRWILIRFGFERRKNYPLPPPSPAIRLQRIIPVPFAGEGALDCAACWNGSLMVNGHSFYEK